MESKYQRTYILKLIFFIPIFFLITAKGLGNNYNFDRINIDHGLSNRIVHDIFKDSKGLLWICTENGINQYNGYKIKQYLPIEGDSTSLSYHKVLKIIEDKQGRLWIATHEGLNIYDRDLDRFSRPYKNKSIRNNYIEDLFLDTQGNLWVLSFGQLFLAKKEELQKSDYSEIEFVHINLSRQSVNAIFESKNHEIWVINQNHVKKLDIQKEYPIVDSIRIVSNGATFSNSKVVVDGDNRAWILTLSSGIVVWDIANNIWKHIEAEGNDEIQINSNIISDIYFDKKGKIWIANNGSGINIYDSIQHRTSSIAANISDPKGLTTNSILRIYVDDSDIMWVGTHNGGVCKYVPSKNNFGHHFHKGTDNSLNNNNVTAFCEDKSGQIWIGTDGGGLTIFNPLTENFSQEKESGIKLRTIVSLCCDNENNIWIGSWQYGLIKFNPNTKETINFLKDPKNPKSISSNNVYSILCDSKGNVWIGTLESGLNLYRKKNNQFIRYRTSRNPNSLANNMVFSLFEDSKHRLWVGHNQGADMIDLDSIDFYAEVPEIQFSHYRHPDKQNAVATKFCEDAEGNIWVGNERTGIYILDSNLEYKHHLTTDNGLSSNQIKSIEKDKDNNIWISSDKGLCKYTPSEKKFRYYIPDDGIQSMDFNRASSLVAANGTLYFGGINGFNKFNPKHIKENARLYPTIITNFKIFDQDITVCDTINNRVILKKSISETKEISLSYRENFFTIEFASLDFTSPDKNEYAYRMEGIDQNWNQLGNRHEATYTNLEPGKYLFKVKSTNCNGFWNNQEVQLSIIITPPFWKTPWMKTIYLFIFFGIIYLAYYMIIHNENLKNQVKIERLELQKAKEVSDLKINFFTNISHEFRTPLTLLVGPLESLINKQGNDAATKKYLSLMYKNAQQLNRLITQLLDFRNLEEGGLKNEPSVDDMMLIIRSVFDSFIFLANQRSIDFSLKCDLESLICKFDHDKLEKILLNLISNAFKYTPDGGTISVIAKKDSIEQAMIIDVEDTGMGISPESMTNLFSVFYKGKDQKAYMSESTGIGLSLTKSMVEVMSGKIDVKSELGHGSIFSITLPIVDENGAKEFISAENNVQKNKRQIETNDNEEKCATDNPEEFEYTILLVEDNPEVINFIENELNTDYNIFKASDGVEGLELAMDKMPDMIISDIMMPRMEGNELCRRIKSNVATSHIPVILLTAKLSSEDQIEGFGAGADEYIPKPFNPSVLRARIANILGNRKKLRELFSSNNLFDITLVANNPTDTTFLEKTMETIKSNVSNQAFDIELFASELNLSRSVFFKKIKTLTSKTPYQLVLDYRMKTASELLTKTDKTVSEIAQESGFNELSNFSRTFTKYYGQSPKKYSTIYKAN